MTNQGNLVDGILDYLGERPESGDTLEGIAKWWIQRQHVLNSVNAVQAALL